MKSTLLSQGGVLIDTNKQIFYPFVIDTNVCFVKSEAQLVFLYLEERNYYKELSIIRYNRIVIKDNLISNQDLIMVNNKEELLRYKELIKNQINLNLDLREKVKKRNTAIIVLSAVIVTAVATIILINKYDKK
jgi:hypothetical protein